MNEQRTTEVATEAGPSITVADLSETVFRHKTAIVVFSVLGVLAAAAFWTLKKPPYQSEAKLLIRYVTESKSPSSTGADANVRSPDAGGQNIINTEVQILTSLDLAEQVADAIGTGRILAKARVLKGSERESAAALIHKNLEVDSSDRSSVIKIVFKHPDEQLVRPVLNRVLETYFKTHLEIHRAGGIVGSFLTQETEQLHTQLAQLEGELRVARNKAGVISVEDAKKAASEQITRLQREIFDAEANLAERQGAVEQLTKLATGKTGGTTNAAREIPASDPDTYRNVCARLNVLWAKEAELLVRFTEDTTMVKDVRRQIADAVKLKKKLEEENPSLTGLRTIVSAQPAQSEEQVPSLTVEATRAASLEARIKVLKAQLAQTRLEASNFDRLEPDIQELQRKKELTDNHYRNLSASLEQYHIDDALGAGKGLNISKIEAPSPPFRETGKQRKTMLMVLVGGVLGGIAWAFVVDMYLDRSVRRSADIESKLGLPLFLSIPDMRHKSNRPVLAKAVSNRLALKDGASSSADSDGRSDRRRFLIPYLETLASRLVSSLEARNVNHKPKLIAVTGAGRGTGVTTIAVGLAASLSKTENGNVLLVDMNVEQGAAQQFYKGKPGCGLEAALEVESRDGALVQDNLYVVTSGTQDDKALVMFPKQFTSLLPKLQASDYDYIIFDMPPITQTSITPRLAGLMDVVVFTAEAGKTSIDAVKRANDLLEKSKANVGFVLNQTRFYAPARLRPDTANDL